MSVTENIQDKLENSRVIVAKLINGEEIIALQNKQSQDLSYVVKTLITQDDKDPKKSKLSIHPYMVSVPMEISVNWVQTSMFVFKKYEKSEIKNNKTVEGYIKYITEYKLPEAE